LIAIPTYAIFIGGRALFRRFKKSGSEMTVAKYLERDKEENGK